MPDVSIEINHPAVTITTAETPVTIQTGTGGVSIETGGGNVSIEQTTTQVDIDFGGPQGPAGPPGADADFSFDITAGEALSARNLIYINSSGNAMKADADSSAKQATGYVTADVANGATGTGYFGGGIITGFTGLTPGAVYYQSATAGAITTTKPTSGIVQQVGVALSSTTLMFKPKLALGL